MNEVMRLALALAWEEGFKAHEMRYTLSDNPYVEHKEED